jgi:DNA-binding MarR family transcriptional regulator
MSDIIPPPTGQFLGENMIRAGMDLMFFSSTRYLKPADDKLALLGLGRAHHRLLYFVARRPDATVSELLAILDVTKQSFGRVATVLVRRGLLEYRVATTDRRKRLLRLTTSGCALERDIFDDLRANVALAYAASGEQAIAGFWIVMQNLMGQNGRLQFNAVQEHKTKDR